MHEIRVKVVEVAGRKYLQMRYELPDGSVIQRSTRKTRKREAYGVAALWKKELESNQHAVDGRMMWSDFRAKYEAEALSGLAESTRKKVGYLFNGLENLFRLQRLNDITPAVIREWMGSLRKQGKSESTIGSYSAHLRAALQWAVDCEWLPGVPKFPKVQRAKTGAKARVMKGRPLTETEFSCFLSVLPKTLSATPDLSLPGEHPVEMWEFYLRGLWLSGLRLEESIALTWEPGPFWIDFSGEFPMFRIDADAEKGNRDRILPITPDFAEHLAAVPREKRAGPVFRLPKQRRAGILSQSWVSHKITAFGRAAAIVVDVKARKFASAHDFRRSFGERWARRVMPQVLMELMRHENIETTMRYYVGRNAEATARELWELNDGNDRI